MIFDTHVHTNFSSDSTMLLEEALAVAQKMKIGIITTEHMDLNYPDKSKFNFDIQKYFATYQKYKSDNFLLGIEIGMAKSCIEKNATVAKAAEFDYILGSIHTVDDMDIYYDVFYRNKTKQEAYEAYFKTMLDCIDTHPYINSLGHIDYIARYAKYEDTEIYYQDFLELIDELLKKIIRKNIALELNTRRFNNKNAIENLLVVYKRYHELGGQIVTLGSDAHRYTDIGNSFSLAIEFIKQCKLDIVYFKNQKIHY